MFLHDLKNCFSDFALDYECNPNISWQIWKNDFFRVWDKHAPVKRRKVGAKGLPWLTTDLIYKKRHVNFLNRKAKTINTAEAWANYKVENHYNRQIKNTKCSYYQDI